MSWVLRLLGGWWGYAAVAGLAVSLTAIVLGWRHDARVARLEADHAVVLGKYERAATEASERARAAEKLAQEETENVRAEYQIIVEQSALATAALGAESVSMRDDLDAANRRAEREAARAGRALDENARIAAELRNVVGMCTERYSGLAAETDRLRGDLMGLQGWARVVGGL